MSTYHKYVDIPNEYSGRINRCHYSITYVDIPLLMSTYQTYHKYVDIPYEYSGRINGCQHTITYVNIPKISIFTISFNTYYHFTSIQHDHVNMTMIFIFIISFCQQINIIGIYEYNRRINKCRHTITLSTYMSTYHHLCQNTKDIHLHNII